MGTIERLLDNLYAGQERMSRDEIHRRAVAEGLPPEAISVLDALPEGEYAQDEVVASLAQLDGDPGGRAVDPSAAALTATAVCGEGVPPAELSDADLDRELWQLHRTRDDTFRRGSEHALDRHTVRMAGLEAEYVRRFPDREVDPMRLRAGARQRTDADRAPQ